MSMAMENFHSRQDFNACLCGTPSNNLGISIADWQHSRVASTCIVDQGQQRLAMQCAPNKLCSILYCDHVGDVQEHSSECLMSKLLSQTFGI